MTNVATNAAELSHRAARHPAALENSASFVASCEPERLSALTTAESKQRNDHYARESNYMAEKLDRPIGLAAKPTRSQEFYDSVKQKFAEERDLRLNYRPDGARSTPPT